MLKGHILSTDHALVTLFILLSESQHSPLSWRLRDNLLTELTIQQFLQDHRADPTLLPIQWEALKCVIRVITFKDGTHLKKEITTQVVTLLQNLWDFEMAHKSFCLDTVRQKLHDLIAQNFLSKKVNIKKCHSEFAHKCSHLLACTIHLQKTSIYISCIKPPEGLWFLAMILDTFKSFYKSLYKIR